MELVFVPFVLLALATPLLTLYLLWRQHKLHQQLAELEKRTTLQSDWLHRQLVELRHEIGIAPAVADSTAGSGKEAPQHATSQIPPKEKPSAPAALAVDVKPITSSALIVEKPQNVVERSQPVFCAWCGTVHAGGVSNCPRPIAPVAPTENRPIDGALGEPKPLTADSSVGLPHAAASVIPANPPQSTGSAESAKPLRPVIPPPEPQQPSQRQPSLNAVPPQAPPTSARIVAPPQVSALRTSAQMPTSQPRMKKVFALEEILGTNWLNKLGIILVVLGVALFGIYELGQLGPSGKVGLSYAVSLALLGGGVLLEKRDRYRVLGHTLIGGGWSLLFFSTYALNHVQAMHVMDSETTDLILMLAVALAMVVHTLRYRSQLVTGLSFLLAYGTVALGHSDIYSLSSGVILAIGLVCIVVKMGWFELEVFGILSSYLTHAYWLYRLLGPEGAQGHAFPEYQASTAILFFYWLIYRISYVVRKTKSPFAEHVSTAAALLNTLFLLGVMKFQSVHPELAFLALLVIGAVEFSAGQLPIMKRRREAFIVLSILGAALMIAAVPFHFASNNVAILWLTGGEVFLVAGVLVGEVVFRRLGLLTGLLVGLHLAGIDFVQLVSVRSTSEDLVRNVAVLFGLCAVVFYSNALAVGRKWKQFFSATPDAPLLSLHSYLGGFAAAAAAWALCSQDWTALGFAAVMLALAALGWKLKYVHLRVQYAAIGALTLYRVFAVNLHIDTPPAKHIPLRLLTLSLLAAAFYLTAKWTDPRDHGAALNLRGLFAAAGTLLIAALIYFEIPEAWVAVGGIVFAVLLAHSTRWIRYQPLAWHADAIAIGAIIRAYTYNYTLSQDFWHGMSMRLITVAMVAAGLYLIARKPLQENAEYIKFSAYFHSAAATALLALLAWYEAPGGWLAPVWAVFALVLAIVDRRFELDELRWQTHALAALAMVQSVTVNLYVTEIWRGFSVRFLSLTIVALVLYALSRLIRIPERWRIREFHHIYSWAGSTIVSLLVWYELKPLSVAVGWAVFGLVLFEFGLFRKISQFRFQAYVALTAAFGRIFFSNLTAGDPSEFWGPRMYTVLPLTLILFFVYAQLDPNEKSSQEDRRLHFDTHVAYLGTGSIVALLYFQYANDWLVAAWAVVAFVLCGLALLLDRPIFLHQGLLLTLGVVARGIAYNCFGASYFSGGDWTGRYMVLGSAVAILLACLPFAFRLRERYKAQAISKGWLGALVRRPEQFLFFAPVALLTLMIALKTRSGMMTVAWGIEGVGIIVLALLVNERSYRLTGLSMLLLCVAKVLVRDAWGLADRDRYLTFIVLGAALLLVSFLYTKYRDTIRQFL